MMLGGSVVRRTAATWHRAARRGAAPCLSPQWLRSLPYALAYAAADTYVCAAGMPLAMALPTPLRIPLFMPLRMPLFMPLRMPLFMPLLMPLFMSLLMPFTLHLRMLPYSARIGFPKHALCLMVGGRSAVTFACPTPSTHKTFTKTNSLTCNSARFDFLRKGNGDHASPPLLPVDPHDTAAWARARWRWGTWRGSRRRRGW